MPDEFWGQTFGTYSLIMDGAADAADLRQREARSQAWQVAYLLKVKEFPSSSEWISGKLDNDARVAKWEARMDAMDAALARNKRKA